MSSQVADAGAVAVISGQNSPYRTVEISPVHQVEEERVRESVKETPTTSSPKEKSLSRLFSTPTIERETEKDCPIEDDSKDYISQGFLQSEQLSNCVHAGNQGPEVSPLALNRPLRPLYQPLATPQLLTATVYTSLSAQVTACSPPLWSLTISPDVTDDGGQSADGEAKARRKLLSLGPCLKSMILKSDFCDQSADSPITDGEDLP